MENQKFTDVVNEQVEICLNMLVKKGEEYAGPKDRLHNFKQAAHLEGITQAQALRGMMAKHTVSIYDMINSGQKYSMAQWDEKITDHINYLLLLKAIVVEEEGEDTLAILRAKLTSVQTSGQFDSLKKVPVPTSDPNQESIYKAAAQIQPKTNYDPITRSYI